MNTAYYCQVLGIDETATLAEIKSAYRQKAKQLHPDRNPAATANQDFVALTEAFEYMTRLKSGQSATAYAAAQQNWQQEVYHARQRAAAYPNMRYKDFEKCDYYPGLSALETVVSHLYLLFVLALIIGLPACAAVLMGASGFFIALAILLVSAPVAYVTIGSSMKVDWPAFSKAILYLAQNKYFVIVFISVINVYLILRIGLQTLIPLHLLAEIFALSMALTFCLIKFNVIRAQDNLKFYTLCIAPLVVNLLFILNYVFAGGAVQETYAFSHTLQRTRQGEQETTFIILNGNKYANYPGIRFFLDYSQMQYAGTITYTFKTGALGFRVMSDYKFEE